MTRHAKVKAAQRARKRALGLVEKHVWVRPDDWPKVYRLAKRLESRALPSGKSGPAA